MYIRVLPGCKCVQCSQSPKEGVELPRTGVSNGYELTYSARNWTQALWKSCQCSSQLSHLDSPLLDIFDTHTRIWDINPRLNSPLSKVEWVALLPLSCLIWKRKRHSGTTSHSSNWEPTHGCLSPRLVWDPSPSFSVFGNIPTLNGHWGFVLIYPTFSCKWNWFKNITENPRAHPQV